MPTGGDISIKTAVIEDHVILKISDTGIGVSSEDMKRLFEPFWSTKEQLEPVWDWLPVMGL